MKRLIISIIAVLVLILSLCGCASVGVCEDCGQKEELHRYIDKWGEAHYYCDFCYQVEKLAEF